jgi:uncharacterized protein
VRYLLDHGATMDVSETVRNPLFAAISGYTEHPDHSSGVPQAGYLELACLLLDRGIDYRVVYDDGDRWKRMDALGFACMWGRQDIARMIAERIAPGDPAAIEQLLAEGEKAAERNTEPVPEGEDVRPS